MPTPSGNTLLDVKEAARTLVGDPLGDFADDDYLVPFVKIAFTNALNYLKNTCSPFVTDQRTLPNVPQGTTTLSPYQVKAQTGQQLSGQQGAILAGLVKPLRVWWKVAGQPENNYCEADPKKDLPFVSPSNYIAGMKLYYEWRQYKLYVTPLSFNADFSVKGEFNPVLPTKDEDEITLHPSCGVALGFMVAALIGGERVNATYIQNWGDTANRTLDDISADLVRGEQATTQRIGRYTGRRRGRGRW